MASASSQHTVYIKRADLPTTFDPQTVPHGEVIAKLRGKYARDKGLDPDTLAFYELKTKEEATAVDNVALSSSARKGREMGFLEKWTKPTMVLAYGQPAGKSSVLESALLSFRWFNATYFIRSFLLALF